MDNDAQRPSGADGDGGLDIEVAFGEALADLIDAVLGRLVDCLDEIAFLTTERQLGRNPKKRRERDALQKPPGMEVHPILEPGIAGRIRRRQVVDHDRGTVGHDDPMPDDKRALLIESDKAVLSPDHPGASRDQQNRLCTIVRYQGNRMKFMRSKWI